MFHVPSNHVGTARWPMAMALFIHHGPTCLCSGCPILHGGFGPFPDYRDHYPISPTSSKVILDDFRMLAPMKPSFMMKPWWGRCDSQIYIYMCTYTYVFIWLYVFLYIFCPAHCWPLELSSRLRRKGNKLMQLILHGCSLHRLPVKKTNANCQEAFARHSSRPERCNSSSYIPFPVRDFWWKEQQEATTSYGDEKNICAETSRRRPNMCILIYLSVCLSVSLSVCRSVRPSIHPFMHSLPFPSLPFSSLLFSSCLVSSRLWSRLFSSLPFSYLILSIHYEYIYIYIYI